MQLIHTLGRSISLVIPSRNLTLWTYVYRGKPKPYLHPVCTLNGHCLTNFEPHDHLWHRGLWFTIKFINGENFWEEHAPFGVQVTDSIPSVTHGPESRINILLHQQWLRPDGQTPVFDEYRELSFQPIDEQAYALDFNTMLTALADLDLDRTPYTTWGGYGGLILRGTRNWQQTRHLFPDGSTSERPTGQRHPWCDLAGRLDGGPDHTGGFAIFDHPTNPRHPTPWYGGGKDINYTNAAFLFHEPLHLPEGDTLAFRYRVLIHDTLWDPPHLQRAYDAWLAGTQHE